MFRFLFNLENPMKHTLEVFGSFYKLSKYIWDHGKVVCVASEGWWQSNGIWCMLFIGTTNI
jgi:hypothetical protein